MSLSKLPSGRWRAQRWDPALGRNVSVGTFATRREAKAAREHARLHASGTQADLTVAEWVEKWTTDPLYQRPKVSTNRHNAERVRAFAARYGSLPLADVGDQVAAEWIVGGRNLGSVPALRAMFNDAASAKAGRLIERNPFAGLRLRRGRGRADQTPPSEEIVWALIHAARAHTTPSFAGWLQVACFTGMRPGELDALTWDRVDLERSRVRVAEQWSPKAQAFTPPKNGHARDAILTPAAREAVLALPREAPWVFPTLRGHHWTPGSRAYHWNATRAVVGFGGALYLASRHFFGAYAINTLGMASEDVAIALGHTDGGELVRRLYGHRDEGLALARVQAAFEGREKTTPLRAVENRRSA